MSATHSGIGIRTPIPSAIVEIESKPHNFLSAPRFQHRGRASRLDRNNTNLRPRLFQIAPDAARQRPISEWKQNRVDLFFPFGQLNPNCSRALARLSIETVFNHPFTRRESHAFRFDFRLIEVFTVEHDRGSEHSHALQLERIGVHARVNRELKIPSGTSIRHRLPEIAGARGDQLRVLPEFSTPDTLLRDP